MKYNIPLPRVLDANMHELRRLDTLHASVTLSLEPLSTATLTLPDRETLSIRNWVELYTSMGSAGIYRVRAPSHNYRQDQKEYQLDHGIAEIGDYIIKNDLEIDSAPASTVIPQIFASYTGTLWQLGTIAAQNTVSYNGSHEDVLSAILSVLADLPDYCLSINQSSLPWTLSVVQKPQTVTAEGRLARNIESCKISEDDQNLCTRIISPDLTGGKLDADTISLYGIVEHYAGKDDDTPQAQFEADCARYLAQHKNPLLSIQIDLLDLHQATGEAYDSAELGAMYRLALPDYNITQQQTVTKLNWPDVYGDPWRVKVTLANEEYTLSSALHSSNASTNSAIEKTNKETAKNKYRWEATDKHVTDQGTILHKAGLEIDAHGVWLYASEHGADYALGSSFKVQADNITAEVARATAAEGTMSSRITQTADAITAEVTRATAAEGTMSSRITQTADAITAEVTRATAAETEAYSRITQTADAITAEVTRATTAEGSLGSRITQTADAINLEVSKKVGNNEIISRINQTAESILIQASKINLSGYVTASQFNALSGSFNNLVSGTTSASKLTASNGNFSNLEITNALTYGGYGDLKKKIINALSSSASGGTITISSTTLDGSAGPSVNFNIADTQYYRNAVASAETDGWNAARAKVAPPSSGTETSFTVDVPSATQGEKQTYTFTIQKGATPGTSGYASVALGQSVVGRISIGDWYSAGYSAGFTAGQTAGEAYGYTQGWNAAEAQYSAASYARKNLNRYGHADMYVKERDTYYPAGNHYWYWSGSDGWDTLYTKS